MKIEVATGEILDKLSILELKLFFIKDDIKKSNIQKEHATLQAAADTLEVYPHQLYDKLCDINTALWHIEDNIRIKERNGEFDDEFIELARSVYKTNDRRAAIKKEINIATGSLLVEEKQYEEN